jgi:putative transposase
MWKIIDQKCWESKNLYNLANYIIRQEFFKTGKWIKYKELDKIMQKEEPYKILGSQASQNTLTLLDKNWKAFFKGIKDWSKVQGEGYLGRPKIPKYKNKTKGRSILMIKNIQCRIENQKLIFSWKPLRCFSGIPTNISGKLMQVRFVPKGNTYMMEIVYETDLLKDVISNNHIVGIDLGVNNFVTMINNVGVRPAIIKGNIIKSMNQWYNKERARMASESKMSWNNKMRNLTDRHLRKTETYMHQISKMVVSYCIENNINTIIVGNTKEWKHSVNLGNVNNQNFVCIPYEKFINQLKYKCEDIGIWFILVDEEFTSGTSFIDQEEPTEENYNIKRRIKRGLFKSNSGTLINADVNGAYQIVKKVYPNAFTEMFSRGLRGCDLHPVELCLNEGV